MGPFNEEQLAVSYTQNDVDKLRSMMAKGLLKGSVAGEAFEFRSLSEMRSLLAEMQASVAGTGAASRQHYPGFMERPS